MLDRLPPSLQQCLLLEWLSPEAVWVLVRASGALRRAALAMSSSLPTKTTVQFRAADKEVLSDACVRWFREHQLKLRLYMCLRTVHERMGYSLLEMTNGKIHSDRDDDDPTAIDVEFDGVEWVTVVSRWFRHGKIHRAGDRPAVVWLSGTRQWCQNGKLHRDNDLPAYIGADGTQEWYQHGHRHRDNDLPAVVRADRTQEWYQHGHLHRDNDLPAIVRCPGRREWWRNGRWIRSSPMDVGSSSSGLTSEG